VAVYTTSSLLKRLASVCVSAEKDKTKEVASKVDTVTSSGGKAEATPPAGAPRSRVKVEPPSVEDILRYPIEVFVSTGEAFVHPESTSAEPVMHRRHFITARCDASAVYDVVMCPSVCLSVRRMPVLCENRKT